MTDQTPDAIRDSVTQIAMYQQRLDALEHGIVKDGIAHPTWEELVALDGQDSYVRDAQRIVDAMRALGWEPTREITTVADLNALPVQSIVLSASGTVACRFDDTRFVVFGDDRALGPWTRLALPARVLYAPDPQPTHVDEAERAPEPAGEEQ